MTVDTPILFAAWISIILISVNYILFGFSQTLYLLTRKPAQSGLIGDRRLADQGILNHVPFISIHVPIYDEPAEIVADTLLSLANLNYPAFEVIVLDNNTPDPATWMPVQCLCTTLGARFRFFHVDGLVGAKAGALNLCLEKCDPRSRYVAVVDADYQVEPDFLTTAMTRMAIHRVDFVQFPQAFRHAQGVGQAVALELEDYFSVFARQANRTRSPLLTGTLSVISLEALRLSGGWPKCSVTEDAELGVALFASRRDGAFVDEVAGRGLLPMSLGGLKAQRRRWIAGNVQTLIHFCRHRERLLNRPGAASVLAQLAAWPAFWLIPMAVLLASALLPARVAAVSTAVGLASWAILLASAMAAARAVIDRNRRVPFRTGVVGPLAVKLALVWVSSAAWLELLLKATIPFVKTPKTPARAGSSGANLWLGLAAGAAMLRYLLLGEFSAALACCFAALTWPAAIWVDRGLRTYGRAVASPRVEAGGGGLQPCAA